MDYSDVFICIENTLDGFGGALEFSFNLDLIDSGLMLEIEEFK
jgi:hypothetical protein